MNSLHACFPRRLPHTVRVNPSTRSSASYAIRRASPADFLDVAALDRVAWAGLPGGEFIPDGEHVWRIWCEHALVYVAHAATGLAGVILAFPCVDGRFCLHKVMVAEGLRGRGIASLLLETLTEELDRRGAPAFLTVNPDNAAARNLYARHGFADPVLVPGFYRPSETRLVLMRQNAISTRKPDR